MVQQEKMSLFGRSLTLLIVTVSIITYGFPQVSSLLVYDRQAIFCGELWRLFTAPVVHFSFSHMFWDTLVFGAAGIAIEAARFRRFWLVCLIAAVIPGLLFLLAYPALEHYGGLSGPATGAVTYFSLCRACQSKKGRMIWLGILVFIGIKIIIEASIGTPLFAKAGKIPFRVLPSAHIIGYCAAIFTSTWDWTIRPEGCISEGCEKRV